MGNTKIKTYQMSKYIEHKQIGDSVKIEGLHFVHTVIGSAKEHTMNKVYLEKEGLSSLMTFRTGAPQSYLVYKPINGDVIIRDATFRIPNAEVITVYTEEMPEKKK